MKDESLGYMFKHWKKACRDFFPLSTGCYLWAFDCVLAPILLPMPITGFVFVVCNCIWICVCVFAKYQRTAACEPLIVFQPVFCFHICICQPLILLSDKISRLAEIRVSSTLPPPHLLLLKHLVRLTLKFYKSENPQINMILNLLSNFFGSLSKLGWQILISFQSEKSLKYI